MKASCLVASVALLACSSSFSQTVTMAPEVLHTFSGTDGRAPMMPPLRGLDGHLYGLAAGLSTRTAYQFDLATGQLLSVAPAGTSNAHTNLVQSSDGRLHFVSGSSANAAVRSLSPDNFVSLLPPEALTAVGNIPGTVIGANAIDDNDALWVGGTAAAGQLPGLTRIVVSADTATATLYPFPGTDVNGPGGSTVLGAFGNNAFSLFYSSADRVIYGMSPVGGENPPEGTMHQGVVWKFDPAADGGNGAYTLLHAFAVDSTLDGTDTVVLGEGSGLVRDSGGYVSAMIEVGDWLYGTASSGPRTTEEIGSIWRMRKDGSNFAVVYHFSADQGARGNYPAGALALGVDGNIYGTTRRSGPGTSAATEGPGGIFRIVLGELDRLEDDRIEQVHVFALNGVDANVIPHGLSRADSDGSVLVGVTRAGGTGATAATNVGTLYKLNIPRAVQILNFSADRLEVAVGDTLSLQWDVTNAVSCEASGAADWREAVAIEGGSATVTPSAGTTVYELSCTGAGGSTHSAQISVVAVGPGTAVIDSFTASASSVTTGTAVVLSWAVSDATRCEASGAWAGDRASSTGTASVTPAPGNNTYTLTCQGTGGSVARSVSVTASAPVVNPTPTPAPSRSGGGGSTSLGLLLLMAAVGAIRRVVRGPR